MSWVAFTTVSPEFCAAVRKCYRQWIDQFKPTPQVPYFANVERKGDSFTINALWLRQNGCDCKEELAMLEKNVRLYPDPYPKKFFIDELLRLQEKPAE